MSYGPGTPTAGVLFTATACSVLEGYICVDMTCLGDGGTEIAGEFVDYQDVCWLFDVVLPSAGTWECTFHSREDVECCPADCDTGVRVARGCQLVEVLP